METIYKYSKATKRGSSTSTPYKCYKISRVDFGAPDIHSLIYFFLTGVTERVIQSFECRCPILLWCLSSSLSHTMGIYNWSLAYVKTRRHGS